MPEARIFAEGCNIVLDSIETARGISMGGVIAEAQNEAMAKEIAHRCGLYPDLLEALREVVEAYDGNVVDAATVEMARAAIAKARGITQ